MIEGCLNMFKNRGEVSTCTHTHTHGCYVRSIAKRLGEEREARVEERKHVLNHISSSPLRSSRLLSALCRIDPKMAVFSCSLQLDI